MTKQMATVRLATELDRGEVIYACSDISEAAEFVKNYDAPEGYHCDIYYRHEEDSNGN